MTAAQPQWDPQRYDALPLPHRAWGVGVVDRLPLTGDERVIDVGCGTGRDSLHLLRRLPRGSVVAVDRSAEMLEALTTKLPPGSRVTTVRADITDAAPLEPVADAAISVAALQWIPDHARAFRWLAGSLRPRARISLEAGGAGNIATVLAALAALADIDERAVAAAWHFPDVPETGELLRRAGFVDVDVRLVPWPITFDEQDTLDDYLASVVFSARLRGVPPAERRSFARAVSSRLPGPTVDFVRLQVEARRS